MDLSFKHRFAVSLLNLISKTWRIKISGSKPSGPAIVTFWHGVMLPAWFSFRNDNPVAIVSLSKDGEILSSLLEKWNFRLIRGSSSKKGKEVLDTLCEVASNELVLMTPDGPKGPIYGFKPGAVIASQRTQVPIYLCGVDIKKAWIFNKSWDNFSLPFPFTTIKLTFSDAIIIPSDSGREEINHYIEKCEKELNEIQGLK